MKWRFTKSSAGVFGPILDKILITQAIAVGLPSLIYLWLLKSGHDLTVICLIPPTCCLLFSVIIVCEVTTTLRQIRKQDVYHTPEHAGAEHIHNEPDIGTYGTFGQCPPRCSFIVAAYLPNEQHILMDTVRHLLEKIVPPPDGFEIIVAYDTPSPLPIEDDLRLLAQQDPTLRLFHANARSKADALNGAVALASGEMICIIDADHQPAPDCLWRAWQWLADGRYDVVQGRNVIRNHETNLLTRMVSIEFECLYGVMHPAKSLLVDTAHFGGTNGYWRASALKQIGFVHGMQTEDIDATLRAMQAGYRLVHDRNIISTELAPDHVRALWLQRKRWAQGWLEGFVIHFLPLLRSRQLPWSQKLYWGYLLANMATLQVIAAQSLPLSIGQRLSSIVPSLPMQIYGYGSAAVLFLCGAYMAGVAMAYRNHVVRYPLFNLFTYFMVLPLYISFTNTVMLVAIYDHLRKHRQWAVTPRPVQNAASSSAIAS
jgi:cellulose synthase/poly-beta-1,6-N-acetylglucosamine synthase-like glycosyltransferase